MSLRRLHQVILTQLTTKSFHGRTTKYFLACTFYLPTFCILPSTDSFIVSMVSVLITFTPNQRKTIVNSWVRCLENNQLVITSGFPTVNFKNDRNILSLFWKPNTFLAVYSTLLTVI